MRRALVAFDLAKHRIGIIDALIKVLSGPNSVGFLPVGMRRIVSNAALAAVSLKRKLLCLMTSRPRALRQHLNCAIVFAKSSKRTR
jgi:hypothetical protein